MATFTCFNAFSVDLTAGKHDFTSHNYKVMLTNTAPVATNAVKADITDISAGNGYTAGGSASAITRSASGTTEKLIAADVTFTATGAIGPFRYAVLYNDTQTSPAKPLVGWVDYGSAVTMANTDTFIVDFDATAGFAQVG